MRQLLSSDRITDILTHRLSGTFHSLLSISIISSVYCQAARALDQPSDLTVGIKNIQKGQTVNVQHPFIVTITNNSKKTINIWDEGCSWGWYEISVHFQNQLETFQDGRLARMWKQNMPLVLAIPAGKSVDRKINLMDKTWNTNALTDYLRKNPGCEVSVTFSIAADKEAKQRSVWTGNAISPSYPVAK